MSQTRAPRYFSIPGKVFILGEYAVLAGLPAVVATVEPRFELVEPEVHSIGENSSARFAPDSPAGRLLKFASEKLGIKFPSFDFIDSTQGGFGASTAQFALTYRALAQEAGWNAGWRNVWSLYRDLTGGGALPPSGADLIAQWQGGVSIVDASDSRDTLRCLDASTAMDWSKLLVFSATGQSGRKVPTHAHLEDLAAGGFKTGMLELASVLATPLLGGVSAIREGSPERLGKAMNDYAGELRRAGLECDETFEDRLALSKLPGVLGTKGTGALQADAILVLVDRTDDRDRQAVIRLGQARGLKLVANGLDRQIGIAGR